MGTGEQFATTAFGQFMAGTSGRIVRGVAGIALIAGGVAMQSTTGYVVAGIGVIPLLAGVFDICAITGIAGGLWTGASVRARAGKG